MQNQSTKTDVTTWFWVTVAAPSGHRAFCDFLRSQMGSGEIKEVLIHTVSFPLSPRLSTLVMKVARPPATPLGTLDSACDL